MTAGYGRHQPTTDRHGTYCARDEQAWPCEVAQAYAAGRQSALADVKRRLRAKTAAILEAVEKVGVSQ